MPLERTRGVICIVTSRQRLAPGQPLAEQQRALVAQARAAGDADADLFQVREPDLPDAALFELVAEIKGAVRGARVRILVNDRPDIAVGAGADGVHLKASGIAVGDARRIAQNRWLLGVSVHSEAETAGASAAGADYVIFGTVFPTASKPVGHSWAGVDGLRAAVRVSRVPVLAIGGVDAARVREVAGLADGVAAIGWFASTNPARLAAAVREARSAFDTTERLHLH